MDKYNEMLFTAHIQTLYLSKEGDCNILETNNKYIFRLRPQTRSKLTRKGLATFCGVGLTILLHQDGVTSLRVWNFRNASMLEMMCGEDVDIKMRYKFVNKCVGSMI